VAFTFGAFFGKDVSTVALGTLKAAPSGAFKAFGRTTIGFHFWHVNWYSLCNGHPYLLSGAMLD